MLQLLALKRAHLILLLDNFIHIKQCYYALYRETKILFFSKFLFTFFSPISKKKK